ncbi:MAG: FAD-dependent oxidoreductase [Ignavibacteria bacterium]|jgi:NADPH-dependent 2,4-dienoyl-CoA reductase/sulfur reductase-like enzyme|nr:FAD-dependent oxidoreductase [Ignavibacteria bacterium]MCU7502213.1 FAD-dependent oxidoreductase [Ignavibacteria bacterium]MCU7517430.1 FAD-dependent oxidoreductase [Ignavibacteria bacterium]
MIKPANIIVIGGNAAGPAAAAKARRTNPEAGVIMFEEGEFISTGTCELPYVVSKEISCYKNLVFFTPETFRQEKGVEVFIRHRVEEIDRTGKSILVRSLEENRLLKFNYDKLVLATGSLARRLPWLPAELENVFCLKSVRDLIAIRTYIRDKAVKSVVIFGAGYIGLEMAESFNSLGCSVTLLEKGSLPLPLSEPEVQHLILEELKERGIEFYGGISELRPITEGSRVKAFRIEGLRLEADLVLVAVGFIPNVSLAVKSRLELGRSGAIKVDNRLRTSEQNIYAAGDSIEVLEKVSGKPVYLPLATVAHNSGYIAGENAAGGNSFMKPVIKNIALRVFDISYVSVGLRLEEAVNIGFKAQSVYELAPNLVKVMPGSKKVFGKIVYDSTSYKILGASFLGGKEVTGYGDLISSFIHSGLDVRTLGELYYNYTPPLSPFIHLLSLLGRKAR